MRPLQKTILVLMISLLGMPLFAFEAKAEVERFDAGDDAELAQKLEDFTRFAHAKLEQMNRNHNFSRSRMAITQEGDGSYRARYHQIDDDSMSVKVRRSQSSSVPFVGILAYQEKVLESSAKTPSGFADSRFAVVEIIPNRHIFSYRKGRWN